MIFCLISNIGECLKDKEVLVTGGCGFIGSEITKQLSSMGAELLFLTIYRQEKKNIFWITKRRINKGEFN